MPTAYDEVNMSKEIELLRRVVDIIEENPTQADEYAINIIEAFLAQHEPEPGAWFSLSDIEWMNIVNNKKILELTNGRHNSEEAVNLAVKMTEEICKKKNSNSIPIPIPKREPLSDDELNEIADKYITDEACAGYFNGFRDAEKAHGIGVSDDGN